MSDKLEDANEYTVVVRFAGTGWKVEVRLLGDVIWWRKGYAKLTEAEAAGGRMRDWLQVHGEFAAKLRGLVGFVDRYTESGGRCRLHGNDCPAACPREIAASELANVEDRSGLRLHGARSPRSYFDQ